MTNDITTTLRDQIDASPFRAAEFWDASTFLIDAITHDGERVLVRRAGEAHLTSTDGLRTIYHPNQFREEFPDGVLPDDEGDANWAWDNNAWFEYEIDGESTEDVSYTLDDVLADLATVNRFTE